MTNGTPYLPYSIVKEIERLTIKLKKLYKSRLFLWEVVFFTKEVVDFQHNGEIIHKEILLVQDELLKLATDNTEYHYPTDEWKILQQIVNKTANISLLEQRLLT